MITSRAGRAGWTTVGQSLSRPYPVTLPMVVLLLLVPGYIFIAETMPGRTLHQPELSLDRAIPLQPVWALVYGAVYLFVVLLPVFVVRQEQQIRRMFAAYLALWCAAYAFFFLYPTRAPRPDVVAGHGFAVWGLRFLYSADPPYNCFPSLHVAHSFASAFACSRVHRNVGIVAFVAAALVAVSTLFTKQHYFLDVVAGIALAWGASSLFLRNSPAPDAVDRDAAPAVAASVLGFVAVTFVVYWCVYIVEAF